LIARLLTTSSSQSLGFGCSSKASRLVLAVVCVDNAEG
jgi:hypothetical protein